MSCKTVYSHSAGVEHKAATTLMLYVYGNKVLLEYGYYDCDLECSTLVSGLIDCTGDYEFNVCCLEKNDLVREFFRCKSDPPIQKTHTCTISMRQSMSETLHSI